MATETHETPRRQQIEDAASTLFRERGYAATSVRDIAHALDMQGGSLYAHVASKEDVLWAIVVRAADRFNAEVGPIAASDRTAARKLRKMTMDVRQQTGIDEMLRAEGIQLSINAIATALRNSG